MAYRARVKKTACEFLVLVLSREIRKSCLLREGREATLNFILGRNRISSVIFIRPCLPILACYTDRPIGETCEIRAHYASKVYFEIMLLKLAQLVARPLL